MQLENNNQDQEQLKQQALLKAEQEKFLGLCYAVFKQNAQGAELLGQLKEDLLNKMPVADPNKDEKHAYFREGQNFVVRSLYQNIEAYERIIKENALKKAEAK